LLVYFLLLGWERRREMDPQAAAPDEPAVMTAPIAKLKRRPASRTASRSTPKRRATKRTAKRRPTKRPPKKRS